MLRLHDRTRRTVSLLIFFLLGPILTLGIGLGVVLRKHSSNARNFERFVGIRTGLDWRIESVEYRRAGVVRLHRVEIFDDLSSQPILTAPRIDWIVEASGRSEALFPEVETASDRSSKTGAVLSRLSRWVAGRPDARNFDRISIPKATLRLRRFSVEEAPLRIRDVFSKLLSRSATLSETPVLISLDEVEIQGVYENGREPDKLRRIRFLRGNLYRTEKEIRSDWTFQIPEVSETDTQRFSVVRDRSSGAFALSLTTGYQPVPCPEVSILCPIFRRFGPGSLFSGEIAAEYRPEKDSPWTLRLNKAFFNNLAVAAFAAEYTPYAVSGTVKGLKIDRATFARGVLTAEGWLEVVNGAIERPLFHRIVGAFDLEVRPPGFLDAPLGAIPFEQCVVFFRLQQDGIVFWSNQQDNRFMLQRGDGGAVQPMSVYFTHGHQRPVSYHAILSVLAPDRSPVVPLTPGSQKILSMIPVESFFHHDKPANRHPTPGFERGDHEMPAIGSSGSGRLIRDARQYVELGAPAAEVAPVPAVPAPAVADPWIPDSVSPASIRRSDPTPAELFRLRPSTGTTVE